MLRFLLISTAICLWPGLLPAIPDNGNEKSEEALEKGPREEPRHQAGNVPLDPAAAAEAHERLGRTAFEQQRFEESISHFEAADALGRVTPEMEKDWAMALLNLARQQEASVLLEKVLSRDPSQAAYRYRLARAYLAEGRVSEALPHLEQVYQQGLRHAGVSMTLARTRFALGQDEKAVELLESFTHTTSSPELLREVGKLLFDRLFYQRALSPLQKAWQRKPGSYEVGMYLALCQYLVGQYDESEKVLAAIRVGLTPPLDYRILLGSVYARMGLLEEARGELEKAIAQAPDRSEGYLNLGLFYLEQKDAPQAMKLLEKGSRTITPGTKLLYLIPQRENCNGLALPAMIKSGDTLRGEFYSQLAGALDSMEQNGSALELYLLVLEVDPRSAAAYTGIGKACRELDSFDVAQQFLRQGLELHPRAPELHYQLGLVSELLDHTEQAVTSYKKAIELEGPNAPAHYWVQLGKSQRVKGRPAAAEASFLKGRDRDPNFAQAHLELGKLYSHREEFERAEQSFEKAVQLDPKLLSAYYQYGLVCLRSGKPEKGRRLLEIFHRKRALR